MNIKKLAVIGFLVVSIAAMSACGCNPSSNQEDIPENPKYTVWGTNNLTSVIQETDYNSDYVRSDAELEFFMAKDEQEFDQLIITAEEYIKSINLTASDLVCGSNKITTDNIQVFMQKYTYCDDVTKWNGAMDVKDDTAYFNHYYPDMLMPMAVAVEYKENFVAKNRNQGFTVRIKTIGDTPAGVYKGNFTLNINQKTETIPVTVTVWDFTLGKATGKSLVYNQSNSFMNGEFDNSTEMHRKYYELCLEYDINPQFFPGYESFIYNQDIDGFVAEIERYWDHPNFTSYCIPNYELFGWGQFTQEGQDLVRNTLIAIAKASSESRNYFDKLTICHPSLDEPYINNTFGRVGEYYSIINRLGEEAITQLEEDGYFDDKSSEFCDEIKYSLTHIPQVLTSYYSDEITYDKVNGWCPTIDNYSTQVLRDLYKSEAERTEGEQWFYTCNQPQYPYPGHYTHQSPVAWRALKWIQYDLDIEGYLTWFIAFFDGEELRNPYTDTQVWALNPNGDGYFFYPGRAYNSDPFPTQKLLTYSDGQEDMDMLNLLERTYLNVLAEYGVSEKDAQQRYDAMMGHMMDRIIDGATNSFKSEDMLNLRKEVAQMILALNNGEAIAYDFDGVVANYTIYSTVENITVNGLAVSGTKITDGKYTVAGTVDLTNGGRLKVETDDSDIDVLLSKPKTLVQFTDSDVKVTAESSFTVNDSVIDFHLQTKTDITFETALKIKINAFGLNKFTEMDNLTFDYTNDSDEGYVLSVLLTKGGNTMELDRYNIPANSTVTISIPLVYNNKNGYNYERNIERTDELKFELIDNSGKTYDGRISKMTFTREG